MNKVIKCLGIGTGLMLISISASGVDLMQAYQDGLQNDPTFAQARATYMASKEATPQALAALLPQLSVAAQTLNQGTSSSSTNSGYTLNASQVVFNFNAFLTLAQAKYTVQSAAATFAAAEQSLMQRTGQAYFLIVQSQEILRYTGEQREATLRQLNALKERYKYGHSTVTDVDQSEGAYDTAVAQYVSAEIDLYNAVENLSKITGKHYDMINALKEDFPLITPTPANELVWSNRAAQDNLTLRAAKLAVIAAQRAVSAQQGNYIPTVQATGSYNSANEPSLSGISSYTYGLNLNWTAFQGGLTMSQVRQAEAQYQQALATRQAAYYQAIADSQSNYINVTAGVLQVESSRQAVKSNYNALKHTEEGFIAGQQTVLDVLQTQTKLFDAEKAYAVNRVRYVTSIINLELAAGSLSPSTLMHLNKWLTSKPFQARPDSTQEDTSSIKDVKSRYNKKVNGETPTRIIPDSSDKTAGNKALAELRKKLALEKQLAAEDEKRLRQDAKKTPIYSAAVKEQENSLANQFLHATIDAEPTKNVVAAKTLPAKTQIAQSSMGQKLKTFFSHNKNNSPVDLTPPTETIAAKAVEPMQSKHLASHANTKINLAHENAELMLPQPAEFTAPPTNIPAHAKPTSQQPTIDIDPPHESEELILPQPIIAAPKETTPTHKTTQKIATPKIHKVKHPIKHSHAKAKKHHVMKSKKHKTKIHHHKKPVKLPTT